MHHTNHHTIANILHLLAGGGLGLISASLATSLGMRSADRLPGESRAPHCFYCYRRFTWQENFPLIGWLLRPGTTTFPCPCGQKTGQWQQAAAEMIGFLLGVLAMYFHDWSWASVPLCLGIGLLPALATVDFHFGIIPDGHNILLGIFGLLFLWASGGDFYLALATSAVLLGLGLFLALGYSKWRGKEMLGLGDVKFFAAAGLWLQIENAPWFLAGGGLIGVLFNLYWKKRTGEAQFPFAPALCMALAICMLYQAHLVP